jgi:hypothetical protein
MALELKPPLPLEWPAGRRTIFLAGSIAQGAAAQWQSQVVAALAALDVVILNPRRDAWDASWRQHIDNPQFREQVEWELDAQERADVIAMYFAPETQAPVTLLELGLFARSGKMIVCCPDGFWRKGNVDLVCRRLAIPTVTTLSELIEAARRRCAR